MTDTSPEAIEPVAWRVRVKSDDTEEWSLLPAGGGADYLNREGYECQPLYSADTIAALSAAPVAMRERAARVAWESEDVYGARGMYGMAKCARNIAAAIRALPLDAPAPTEPHKSVLDGNEAPAPVDTVRAQIETLHREACRVLSDTPDSLHAQGYEAGLQRAMMAARGFGDTPAADPVADAAPYVHLRHCPHRNSSEVTRCLWCETEYRRTDLPPTLAEAMTVPEVRALLLAAWKVHHRATGATLEIRKALRPFEPLANLKGPTT